MAGRRAEVAARCQARADKTFRRFAGVHVLLKDAATVAAPNQPDTRPMNACLPPALNDDSAQPADVHRRQHLRLWAGGALLGLAAPLAQGQAASTAVDRPAPPALRLITPPGHQPIQLRLVDIQAEVVGRVVATRIEIHLRNPNPQVLEAELQFPLLEGQVVTGFALDIQGQLRAAVPVEKARGREVFEAIVRRGVDPALLEATQGTHHKLRVYPLPAGGMRRVVLELSETLSAGGGMGGSGRRAGHSSGTSATADAATPLPTTGRTDATAPIWRLPLRLGGRVELLQISVLCVGLPAAALSARIGSQTRPWADDGNGNARLDWSTRDHMGHAANAELRVHLPLPDAGRALISTQRAGDLTCFYAELLAPAATRATRARARPAQLTLWWDASGSGASRDHALELAWLDAWLHHVGNTVVHLVELRDVAQPPRRFEVRAGQWDDLRLRLTTLVYDGASQLGDLRPVAGSELGLLVSDGLGNYGAAAGPGFAAPGRSASGASRGAQVKPAPGFSATGRGSGGMTGTDIVTGDPATTTTAALPPPPPLPLLVLCATPDADTGRLRRLAESSGGACIDLLAMPLSRAIALALHERCRLLGLSGRGVSELEGAGQLIDAGRFSIAGQLTAPRGEVDLLLQWPGGARQTLTVTVTDAASRSGAWASQHGKAGMTGSGTPGSTPAALSAGVAVTRWAQMRLATLETDPQAHRAAIRRLGQRFGLVTRETSLIVLETLDDYARHDIEPPADLRDAWLHLRHNDGAVRPGQHARGLPPSWQERQRWWATDYTKAAPRPDIAARRHAETAKADEVGRARRLLPKTLPDPATASVAAPLHMPAPAAMAAPVGAPAARQDSGDATARIALQPWQANSAWLQRLRAAAPAQRYAIYLDERPGHTRSTAFFLDMAEVFFAAGQTELALRIVSNLAEMDLENRQVLRILACRLLAAGQVKTALPVLEQVLQLAPDEPQSWRDLALALDRAGQHQRAVDLLWEVASRRWPHAGAGIGEVALAELNAIAAR
ncbi:MAG: hypothetical protein RLZZ524_1503, partial [Pseudomonadota bacterium]